MTASPLLADLFAPFPGRLDRTLEICFVCMLVIVVAMTFQIPAPDISAYVIFFAAKENSGLNIVTCVIFVVVITVIVAILFLLAPFALNHPTIRIGVIGAVSYVAFFLGSSSKLAAVTGVFGLVTAYALDLLQESFVGEITTRGFLYAWLFVCMPMSVFAAYSLVFGRHPEHLLRGRLAGRLRLAANALRSREAAAPLAAAVAGGNAAFMVEVAMIKVLRRQPRDTLGRLAALVSLSYALLITVAALQEEPEPAPSDLPARLDALAARVERLPETVTPADAGREPPPVHDLRTQAVATTAAMEDIVAGGSLPKSTPPAKEKAGFFVPDAFTNPVHTRYALKGTLSVLVCYITFNLLDWPGIHTCLITCFIVALKTVGETLQKMILRLSGCLVGAALGLAAIVYLLPETTSITDLVLVIGLVTFPAAWVAVGKPSVSYIGFQISLAIYLCILQGVEPKFDLTVARDRIIGVLFGNIVVYVIFTRVFPVSILTSIREDLARLMARCRDLLKALSSGQPGLATAKDVGEVQAMLGALEGKVAALGLEQLGAPRARLYAQASRLSVKALHGFVSDLARLAAYPPPAGSEPARRDFDRLEVELGGALDHLAGSLGGPSDPSDATDPVAWSGPGQPSAGEPAWAGRIEALRSCRQQVDRLGAALARYRRLLREEAGANA